MTFIKKNNAQVINLTKSNIFAYFPIAIFISLQLENINQSKKINRDMARSIKFPFCTTAKCHQTFIILFCSTSIFYRSRWWWWWWEWKQKSLFILMFFFTVLAAFNKLSSSDSLTLPLAAIFKNKSTKKKILQQQRTCKKVYAV